MSVNNQEFKKQWWVYIVKCADNTFYTGVTTDIGRRINEHNHEKLGAKYTKARRPVELAYKEACKNRSTACQRESTIKRFTRKEKLKLIGSV